MFSIRFKVVTQNQVSARYCFVCARLVFDGLHLATNTAIESFHMDYIGFSPAYGNFLKTCQSKLVFLEVDLRPPDSDKFYGIGKLFSSELIAEDFLSKFRKDNSIANNLGNMTEWFDVAYAAGRASKLNLSSELDVKPVDKNPIIEVKKYSKFRSWIKRIFG